MQNNISRLHYLYRAFTNSLSTTTTITTSISPFSIKTANISSLTSTPVCFSLIPHCKFKNTKVLVGNSKRFRYQRRFFGHDGLGIRNQYEIVRGRGKVSQIRSSFAQSAAAQADDSIQESWDGDYKWRVELG
eukprot:TRINITY_DN10945_c0_g1_i8.p2 TRINITY_DN10945_c0_g1~~TRINITY_DN10945_c0_g1_i8.p2  ORF type:complete len:132 (-),score=4.21 TRINITY_DN10945_c0_g1_i8:44-439(-)